MRRGWQFLPIPTLVLAVTGCGGGIVTPADPLATPIDPSAMLANPPAASPLFTPTPEPATPVPTRVAQVSASPAQATPSIPPCATFEAKVAPWLHVRLRVAALSFADPEHGWKVLGDRSNLRHDLYATTDGGQTWQQRQGPDTTTADSIGFISVDFIDSELSWLIDRGSLCYAANGGTNWTQAR